MQLESLPNFTFTATNNTQGCLNDLRGKWIVIYFYPKDATPGCTIEGRDFRDAFADFQALNTIILGVSRDTLPSHEQFKCKHTLPFELISDTDEVLCELFDVMRIKSFFGKKIRSIERSTFILDPQGNVVYSWRKVKLIGHVEAVKSQIKVLQSNLK